MFFFFTFSLMFAMEPLGKFSGSHLDHKFVESFINEKLRVKKAKHFLEYIT